jgi:hypothetical protein
MSCAHTHDQQATAKPHILKTTKEAVLGPHHPASPDGRALTFPADPLASPLANKQAGAHQAAALLPKMAGSGAVIDFLVILPRSTTLSFMTNHDRAPTLFWNMIVALDVRSEVRSANVS